MQLVGDSAKISSRTSEMMMPPLLWPMRTTFFTVGSSRFDVGISDADVLGFAGKGALD